MVLATPATVSQSAPVFPSTGSSAYTSKWKGNNTRRQHNKKPLLIYSFYKNKGHSIEACYTRQRILKNTAALTQSELSTMESPSQPSQEASTTPSLSLADLQDMVNQVHIPSSSASNTALSTVSGNSPTWLLHSACCNHMSSSPNVIPSHTPSSLPTIYTANDSSMHVSHQGTISTPNLSVSNVYHIPQLTHNLLSVGQLTELGFSLTFSSNGVVLQDPQTGQIIGTARKVERLFELISLHLPFSHLSAPTVSGTSPSSSLALWHSRLGHASISRVKELASMGLLGSVSIENFDCMPCQLGKQTALPVNNSVSHALSSFDLIHSNVWGPSPIATQGGSRYFVIFVDDFSRYTWIYLFKNRSELSQIYRDFTKMIETQFSKPIKVFRSDNAQEYKAHEFTDILHQSGTIPHSSCASTSQQNGRAERKLRHILDVVRAITLVATTPSSFWGEAALTAVYTINRCPSPIIKNQTPYGLLFGSSPSYDLLRVFGYVCFVLLHEHERNKLQSRSRLCCFLGYGIGKKGYRCYDHISKRLRVSRHVVFWEHKMFYKIPHVPKSPISSIDPVPDLFPEESPPTIPALTPSTSDLPSDEPSAPIIDVPYDTAPAMDPVGPSDSHALRRSHRVTTLPSHLRDFHCFSTLAYLQEPQSFCEASSNPLWQQAMKEELDALHKTGTWDLVYLPPGKSAIGCKWIYKIKTRSDGTVDRYKARLFARGFTQEYGIDYEETFAPVARLSSVRTLIVISAARRWPLFQMDVKNVFLNGELSEEVYMKLPPGYSQPPRFPNRVCQLRRALYGLKQAPRAWFEKFSSIISQHGFSGSSFDTTLFLRRSDHGTTILLLYVDDMIITGDDMQSIQDLKFFLGSQFEIKDLGPLNYFLGIEVSSSADGYYLTQAKYTSDLISRANITDSKIVDTPIEYNCRLNSHDGESLSDATLYRQLVGSLIYLTVTRPDISYAVHIVSQFMAAPRSPHYAAVLRILR